MGLFAGYIGTSEMLLTLLNIARQPTVSYQQSIRVFDQNHFKEKQQIYLFKIAMSQVFLRISVAYLELNVA